MFLKWIWLPRIQLQRLQEKHKTIKSEEGKYNKQTSLAIGWDRSKGIGPPPPPPLKRGLNCEVVKVTDCWSGCGLSLRKRRPRSRNTAGITSWKTIVFRSLLADIALLINSALVCCQNVDPVKIQQLQHCMPKKLMKLKTVATIKPHAFATIAEMKPKNFL